jgi:CheY-like chemotaxis protein
MPWKLDERNNFMNKVLIVDDEPDVCGYLSDELVDAGYKTGTANDGVEAVLMVLNNQWDAIIMDIRMPKLDGIGALRIIRRISPQIPIIMFTGQAGQGDMGETSRLGAYTCLVKPISPEKLLSLLKDVLKK